MPERLNVSSGAPWESKVGYSRAVRVGGTIHVSGTTATDAEGNLVGGDDAYAQTAQALRNVRTALEKAGAAMSDVVRTRYYVTDISQWEAVGSAHSEVLGEVMPTATMVQVAALIHPLMLVEVEAEAVVDTP